MGMMVAVTFAAAAYQRVGEPYSGSPGGSNPEALAPSSFCFVKCLVK